MNDLRIPIGGFFVLLGGLLLAAPHGPRAGAPVNLYTGLTMVAFGVLMLWWARRKSGRS